MYDLPKRLLFVAWLLAMGVAVTRLVIGIRTSAIPPDPPPIAQAPSDGTLLPAAQPAPSATGASGPALATATASETGAETGTVRRAPRRVPRRRSAAALPDEPPQSTVDASDPAAATDSAPAADPALPEVRPGTDFPLEGPISTPAAREALRLVGVDPQAEAAWARAINDPDRPASERKNLIEDLNEEGFPDPKRITADDLPLIRSRLSLIEEMAPDAIDQVNADAFAEAYKDLLNLYNRFARQ